MVCAVGARAAPPKPMRARPDIRVLADALAQPHTMAGLQTDQWGLLVREARAANVLSRLALAADDLGLTEDLPPKVQEAFAAAADLFAYHRNRLRWEVNRVQTALRGVDSDVLLMKGAAYEFAGLPPARGRLASDLDIMVPQAKLTAIEAALLDHGWYHLQQDDYDQHYFRRWMHELPPLVHRVRGTVLDVHHGILPRTSRLKPDSGKLWQTAEKLPSADLYVLSPRDMVLHSAAHAFHDGELRLALRDLVDLHDLLTVFGAQANFWADLFSRARELDLVRPVAYAVHFAHAILGTPVPEEAGKDLAGLGPPRPALWLMDRLVPKVLVPPHPDRPPPKGSATLLLYMRSHWLKMPPHLLTGHLLRKALKRARQNPAEA